MKRLLHKTSHNLSACCSEVAMFLDIYLCENNVTISDQNDGHK